MNSPITLSLAKLTTQKGKTGLPAFVISTRGPEHIIEFFSLSGSGNGQAFSNYFTAHETIFPLLDKVFLNGEAEEIALEGVLQQFCIKGDNCYLHIEARKNALGEMDGLIIYGFENSALVSKEQVFYELAEAMPQLVWIADADGKVFYYNGRVAEYSGAKKQEDGAWSWEGLLHKDDAEPTALCWENAVRTGMIYEKEHRVKMADGTYQWHLSRAFPQRDPSGMIINWFGTATNIHTQKTFEEKIAEKEERTRIAIEAAEMGTWDIDLITEKVVASEKLNQILGLPGKNPTTFEQFLTLVHPADVNMVYEKSREVVNIENGIHEFDLQFRIIRADNREERWMKAKGRVYENTGGKNARFAGSMVDITKEKNAERDISLRKALLEAQNEAIPDGMLIVDGKGSILSFNKHFAEIWRMPLEIVRSGNDNAALDFAMTQVSDPEAFISRVEHLYKSGPESDREEIQLIDGRVLERYGRAVIGEDHHTYGWAWHFRDITEQKRTEKEIILQKVLYQNILEGISDAFISYDFSWKLIYANKKAADLSGKPVEDLIGKKLWELYPEMVETDTFQIFQKVMTQRTEEQFEYFSVYSNTWLDMKVYPTIEGIAIFGIDISVRKKAEEALNYQKKLLETVTANTSMGLFLMDDQQKCIYMNEAAEKLTGFSNEELKGQTLHKYIHHTYPDGRPYPLEECPIDRALPLNKRTEGEELFFKKSGQSFEVAFTASPIVLEKTFVGTVIEIRDITEEKKAANALKESEENFRQLADLIPQIIFTAKPDGYVDYYNKRWYEFTGNKEDFGDQSWIPVLHPDDVKETLDHWYHSVKTGELYQVEYRFKNNSDGQYRWYLGKALPIKNKKGEIVKWFGTCTDIDDQKRFSEKLEGIVKERTEALERSNEDLQQFAHVASHDLKEPLRKIRTFSSRIMEEFQKEMPDKAKNYLEKISGAAKRMNTIIEGVLEYSTLDAIQQSFEKVDLNDIIQHIEQDLEVVIHNKKAKFQYANLPEFEGSSILIHQLFYNLINNSLKFSKPDVAPLIKIESSLKKGLEIEGMNFEKGEEDFAEILLSDNGIGFNQEYAHKIFDTFSRLNPKDRFEGTGLGLSLCRKIVMRHKGLISAEGNEGEGAKFRIILPLHQH